MPVQDVYNIDGEQVLVGKILSGSLVKGGDVIILPGLEKAKIQSLKIFNESPKRASRGGNIGAILDRETAVKRGCMVVEKKLQRV